MLNFLPSFLFRSTNKENEENEEEQEQFHIKKKTNKNLSVEEFIKEN